MLNNGLALRLGESFVPVYEAMRVREMANLGLTRYTNALEVIEVARERSLSPWPEPKPGEGRSDPR